MKARGSSSGWGIAVSICAALGLSAGTARAADEIFDLELEQLLELEITSVSKRPERAGQAAAAVYVITGEELRRSGVRTIAEALRGVPGINVAQVGGNRWGVSSRGFGGVFVDKLLVLMDGRTLYTPLFSGVFWDIQNTLLEDIERIEIIRGPGGTIWGSNAVNGVINILTRRAENTQGTFLQAGGGVTEQFFVEARRGGQIGEGLHWRTYGTYLQRDAFEDNGAVQASDPTEDVRGGIRSEWALSGERELRIQGDVYRGASHEMVRLPDVATLAPRGQRIRGTTFGADVLVRLDQRLGDQADAHAQLYYDVTDRDWEYADYRLEILDFEFQHRWRPVPSGEMIWGGSYRMHVDDYDETFYIQSHPESQRYDLLGGMAQWEQSALGDRLRATFGVRFEKNDFSGVEWQPSARVAWLPRPNLTVWGAVSRAARTPSRGATDVVATFASVLPPDSPLPTEVSVVGDVRPRAEDLVAYELGIRLQPAARALLDLGVFYHRYEDGLGRVLGPLLCTDGTPITGGPSITACAMGGNRLRQIVRLDALNGAQSKGVEAALRLQASSTWQIDLSYTFFHVGLDEGLPGSSLSPGDGEREWPEHQAALRSRMTVRPGWTVDASLFYVDELRSFDVDDYVRLDLRVAWQVSDRLELSLVGLNLIEEHEELEDPSFLLATRVPRSAFAVATWRY